MHTTVVSIRHSFRQFRRQPLYAFSIAGTLALAVAAATASFAVVKRAFLDPLPYRDAHELVSVMTLMDGDTWALSAPVFEDLRASGPSIASYAPIDPEGVRFSDGQSATEQTPGAYITPEYFTTLGIRPAVGDVWRAGEQRITILSWQFWQQRLAGDPNVVGRSVMISGVEHTVAGVMPESFVPPYFTTTSVWLPLDMQPLMAGSGRARRTLSVVARLSPGATVEELNTQLDVLTARLKHGPTQPVMPTAFGSTPQYSWPRRNFSVRSELSSAALTGELRAAIHAADPDVAMGAIQTIDDLVANQTGRHRLVMFTLGFFAVVATGLCALGLFSVVTLTSQMRRREYAIRLALGAARGDVRSMVFREALVLAVIGAVAGVLVAASGTRVLGALLHGVTPLDVGTFGGALALVLTLALAAASLPARAAGRVDPVEALRAE